MRISRCSRPSTRRRSAAAPAYSEGATRESGSGEARVSTTAAGERDAEPALVEVLAQAGLVGAELLDERGPLERGPARELLGRDGGPPALLVQPDRDVHGAMIRRPGAARHAEVTVVERERA